MANVNIRVDDRIKREAERIFSELGLSMSTATNVFYRQVVRCGGIPFDLKVDPFYSAENQAHLKKAIGDYEAGKSKPVVKNMDELEKMEHE
ncbi:MAG TPA: type II toxin-antitoxin system antitoxin, RelB/DinJ family [Ruminococcaceae bacterium]|jgi:DNA-damage-inducible protein J|nr:type II toxin-antitoxin system antitoxin, RelB/DinJ family [Oscillospiraceae bacterium]HBG54976.1 type II toxin-antitoxin system antitoxin, RelB/DinJ family [Oscillospiraceae bacterium]HCB91982.1 type II toxin-antitoxin system antitoxin, RelB/DinJ family [Oscillospiraceae bacterium]